MAVPITFRNVPGAAIPNFGSELFAMQRAAETPNIFDSLADVAETAVADQKKIDTDAFVAQLNSFRDVDIGDGGGVVTADAQRQQFLEQQLGDNSFIDAGLASKAVTDNRAQDFLEAREGRAVSAEGRAVADQRIQEETHTDALQTSQDIRDIRQLDKEIGEVNLESTKLDLDAAKRKDTREQLNQKRADTNRAMQSTPAFDQHDMRMIQPMSFDPENATVSDWLHSDKVMLKELQEAYPDLTFEQYTEKINKEYEANGLSPARAAAFAQAKRTPAGKIEFNKVQAAAKRNFKFDQTTADATRRIAAAQGTDRNKAFVEFDKEFRKRLDRTPQQQAQHAQLEEVAVNSWEEDITGLKIGSEDFTALPSTGMTAGKIKAFERKMAKLIRKNENFPGASDALVLKLTQRAVDLVGDGTFSANLTTARNNITVKQQLAQRTATAQADIVAAPIEAEAQATRNFQDEVQKINQEGVDINTLSKSIFDNLVTNNKDEANVDVTFDDVNEGVTRTFNELQKLSPTLPPGDIQTIVRKFFNAKGAAASNAFWVISGGELSIRTGADEKQEIENMSPEDIRNALIDFLGKSEGKTVTPNVLQRKISELTGEIIKLKTRNTVSSIIPGREPDFAEVDKLERQRDELQQQLDDIGKSNQ